MARTDTTPTHKEEVKLRCVCGWWLQSYVTFGPGLVRRVWVCENCGRVRRTREA